MLFYDDDLQHDDLKKSLLILCALYGKNADREKSLVEIPFGISKNANENLDRSRKFKKFTPDPSPCLTRIIFWLIKGMRRTTSAIDQRYARCLRKR